MGVSTVNATVAAGSVLGSVVTAEMCAGVLDEIVALLPTVLPVTISFIAIRKGISFVTSTLHAA